MKKTHLHVYLICIILIVSIFTLSLLGCTKPDENKTIKPNNIDPKSIPNTDDTEEENPIYDLNYYLENHLYQAYGHESKETAPPESVASLSGFEVGDYDFFMGYPFNGVRGDGKQKILHLIKKYNAQVLMYKNEWEEYIQCPVFICDNPKAMLEEYIPIQREYSIFHLKLNTPYIEDYYIYKDKIALPYDGARGLDFYKILDVAKKKDGLLMTKDEKVLINTLGRKETVVVPNTITDILNNAFQNQNTPIKKINFASGTRIKRIGKYAFRQCRQLEFLYIPASVEYIGSRAISHYDGPHLEIVTPLKEKPSTWDGEFIDTSSYNYSITYNYGSPDARKIVALKPNPPEN